MRATLRVGETVQIAYVDQSRDALNPANTVWAEASGKQDVIQLGGREEINSRAYLAQFNFRGTDQQKLVGQLSGGERNRLHLAKLLAGGGNLLLLDEPTNDLDVDTLRALEDALASFSGCVMVTSHDRWFIDRLATHILAFEGDSQVRWFEGNYQEYEEFRKRELGPEAAQPAPHHVPAIDPLAGTFAGSARATARAARSDSPNMHPRRVQGPGSRGDRGRGTRSGTL